MSEPETPDAVPDAAPTPAPIPDVELETIREKIVEVLQTIFDPEIPVSIYDLGLIYEINLDPQANAEIQMTLTSPSCPVAEILPIEVEQKVADLEEVPSAKVEIVWEPTWTPEMLPDHVKLQLGLL